MSSLFRTHFPLYVLVITEWLGSQQKLHEWRVPQALEWKTFMEEADLGFIVLDVHLREGRDSGLQRCMDAEMNEGGVVHENT